MVSQTAVSFTLRGPCKQKSMPQISPHLVRTLSVTWKIPSSISFWWHNVWDTNCLSCCKLLSSIESVRMCGSSLWLRSTDQKPVEQLLVFSFRLPLPILLFCFQISRENGVSITFSFRSQSLTLCEVNSVLKMTTSCYLQFGANSIETVLKDNRMKYRKSTRLAVA